MMHSESEHRIRRYSEGEVHSILKRAVQLDEIRRATWSDAELVDIAAELGIPEPTLRRALAEFAGSPAALTPQPRRHYLRLVALGLAGVALAAPAVFLDVSSLVSILAVGAATVGLSLDLPKHGTYVRYWLRTGALWAGFYGTILLRFGIDAPSVVMVTGIPVLAGTVAAALFRRRDADAGASPAAPGLLHRLLRRVKSWLDAEVVACSTGLSLRGDTASPVVSQ